MGIDVVRLTVAFDTADQIMVAHKILQEQKGFKIVRYKNKFRKDTPQSFRNLMVNVEMPFSPDGGKSQFKIIGELQLTTLEWVKLKKVQHKLYEIIRAFKNRSNEDAYKAILNDICKISSN